MNDTKPWYQSKTIWGSIIAMIAPLLTLATHNGVHILPADQDQLADMLSAGGTAFGGIVAIIGRSTATTTIAAAPKQIAPALLLGACLVQLAACTPDLSAALAQAKDDHASVCASVVGMWGTVSVARANEPGTTIKCPGEIDHGIKAAAATPQ